MAEKVGSSIVTYRLKLRCDHIDWIQEMMERGKEGAK